MPTKVFSQALALCLAVLCPCLLHAQVSVTTNGGNSNVVPVFNSSSSVANSSLIVDPTSGNVGVKTSPKFTFDVSGDLNISGAFRYNGTVLIQVQPGQNNFYFAGSGTLNSSSANGNIGFGNGALSQNNGNYNIAFGQNTLGYNQSGQSNVALGVVSLRSNTIGSYNMAIGTFSLYSSISGSDNVAVGTSALQDSETGSANMSIGSGSLQSLMSGSSNTAIGSNALAGLESGQDVVALGDGAGDDDSTIAKNTNGSQNIFLGASSKPSLSGDSNEIVIGAYANGAGSNTVTLGNTAIATTVLRGNVGVGTTAPQSPLEVNGSITMTAGSNGVLTFPDGSKLASANGLTNGGSTAQGTTAGSTNAVAKFTSSSTLGNSAITESNGLVGVGTANPQALLHLFANTNNGSNLGGHLLLDADGCCPGNSTGISFANGGINYVRAGLQVQTEGFPFRGAFRFLTSNPGTPLEEQVRITGTGNVGIGTETPNSELSIVVDNGESETGAHFLNPNPAGYSVLRLGVDGILAQGGALHAIGSQFAADPASAYAPGAVTLTGFNDAGLTLLSQNANGPIRFFTGAETVGHEYMRLTPGGNLGIGVTAPASKVEVNGSVTITKGSGGVLVFQDGTSQSTAASSQVLNSGNGVTTIQGTSGGAGFQLSANSQVIGGAFGAGGNLAFQANEVTDPATGGFLWLGGSQRGDSFKAQAYMFGNLPGASLMTGGTTNAGILVDGQDRGAGVRNYVGIGMLPGSVPRSTLDVNGSVTISGSGASVTFPDSTIQATAWNGTASGGDYAESVEVTGEQGAYEPGDVIVIDPKQLGSFSKSSVSYSHFVAGVYSTKPGLTGRRLPTTKSKEDEIPMAMMGIVPTKVSAENGPVDVGDLLVSSTKQGFAMKGTERDRMLGAVIGKALEPVKSGEKLIEVLITLQ